MRVVRTARRVESSYRVQRWMDTFYKVWHIYDEWTAAGIRVGQAPNVGGAPAKYIRDDDNEAERLLAVSWAGNVDIEVVDFLFRPGRGDVATECPAKTIGAESRHPNSELMMVGVVVLAAIWWRGGIMMHKATAIEEEGASYEEEPRATFRFRSDGPRC